MGDRLILSEGMQRDFNDLICEELIATGSTREVWSSRAMPDCVIKIERAGQSFQNVAEWQLWKDVCSDPEVSKWLAPCRWISPNGSILIMERTKPLPHSKYPDRLPKFLTDTKFQNYGLLKGRFVCHDYGNHCTASYGANVKLRAAHWWDSP